MAQFKIFKLLLFVATCLFLSSTAAAQVYTHQDSLRGSLNPARMYDVKHYDLILRIDTATHEVIGKNRVTFVADEQLDSIQIDLFSQFKVHTINYQGQALKYSRVGNHLFAYFPMPVPKGLLNELEISYSGKPNEAVNPPWDGGFIWRRDSANKLWLTVACQGLGASSWWPCKDHLSDEPDSMNISVTIPGGLKAISNGQYLGEKRAEGGYVTHKWKVSYPINTYNVTLNIGDYRHIHDTYKSLAGELALDYYVLPDHVDEATTFFKEEVIPMLDCFEKYFGPYPFTKDGFALVETPYWGMEHQSAVAYGNNFKRNDFGFDFIIVHESGHEWWGNSVSCKDNAELWLHESFTTYSEALYMECRHGKQKALEYLDNQKYLIQNQQPVVGPLGVNFHGRSDNDIYYKGSWMLHTLRHVIDNDSMWFKIIYDFQQKNSMKTVVTADFIHHVNSYTGKSYKKFFNQYLYEIQPPRFVYSLKQDGKDVLIKYKLESETEGFEMPLIVTASGVNIKLKASPTFNEQRLLNTKVADVKLRTDLYYVSPELKTKL